MRMDGEPSGMQAGSVLLVGAAEMVLRQRHGFRFQVAWIPGRIRATPPMDNDPLQTSCPEEFRPRAPEAVWRETCRPPLPLPFRAVFSAALVLLGVVLGMATLLGLLAGRRPAEAPPPVSAAEVAVPPRSARAVLAAKSHFVLGFEQGMASEAGWDLCARMKAEAIRLETESRLAGSDMLMVIRLAEWRRQLGSFQDLMVELAEVATHGGTWAGHEMDRNDLDLEESLLAPHARALGEVDGLETTNEPVPLDVQKSRTETWNEVWDGFESSATRLRKAGQRGDFWIEQLPGILKEARDLHESMAGPFGEIRDEDAALAVKCYLTGYLDRLADHFPGADDEPASE